MMTLVHLVVRRYRNAFDAKREPRPIAPPAPPAASGPGPSAPPATSVRPRFSPPPADLRNPARKQAVSFPKAIRKARSFGATASFGRFLLDQHLPG